MLKLLLPIFLFAALGFLSPAISRAADPIAEPPLSADDLALVRNAESARIAAIAKVTPTVVCVFGNDRAGGGSGVLFDPSGLALTNHHVVAAAGAEGFGGLADGKLYRWKLVGTDPGGDIAIIKLDRKEPFTPAAIGDSDALRIGDWALVMGNPFALADNYQPTATLGIVSGVKRYQPGGGGKNQLIYGNCIQVDASINPGNSGGPLFNLQSQLVGINGRGSFQERGRVNVGLGYAVSMRQVLNFIPDLLATKIALHGTLDALFANRAGKVVCSTIDLDSAAARAGLALGDELVSFDGEPIADANEFTNLVTTLPAGWPVRLVCRRGDREFSIEVPLSPLPYALVQPKEEKDPHAPPGNPPKPTGAETDDPPAPRPRAPRPGPKLGSQWSLENAGRVNDAKLCQDNAQRVLDRLSKNVTPGMPAKSVNALRIKNAIVKDGKPAGHQEMVFAQDGRFRVDLSEKPYESFGYDGREFWLHSNDRAAPEAVAFARWIEQPLRQHALAVALALCPKLATSCGTLTIDGGDRIGPRRAYRLRVADAKGASLLVWASLDLEGDFSRHDLLAVGLPPIAGEPGARMVFSDPDRQGGPPKKAEWITKVGATPQLTLTTELVEAVNWIAKDVLPKPETVKPNDAKK